MTTPLFPLTEQRYTCPKCRSASQMIQHMPIWVCPICRSTLQPPLEEIEERREQPAGQA